MLQNDARLEIREYHQDSVMDGRLGWFLECVFKVDINQNRISTDENTQ